MLVDSHAHIYSEYYESIQNVCINANENGIKKIINCATNFENMKEVKKLSKENSMLYYTYGIHPEEIDTLNDYKLLFENEVIASLKDDKFIGIGEIGLDYHYNSENKEEQKKLFIFQLQIAEKYNLPVIIHSREATKDTIEILKMFNLKGIIHCFSAPLEVAREYISLGYKLGIGGVLTFKNCNLKEYIEKIGIENIVLETDSPYMTPEPFRGTKNEPKNVKIICEFLSKTLNMSYDEVENQTILNVEAVFDFK